MTWSRGPISARKARLPSDWKIVRQRVLNRDGHACQMPMRSAEADRRCGLPASHVDHIEPGSAGAVPDSALWALCAAHHLAKTAREGGVARAARYRKRVRRRPHPGLVDP